MRKFLPRDVFIAGVARTPIGAFCGGLSGVSAPRLGAAAISAALERAKIQPEEVDTVMFGQALPSGCGQNSVRQASLLASIPPAVDCTGINKACSSGLKAITLAAQAVALGTVEVAVAGGMENMSQAPYLVKQARMGGYHYGHGALEDSVLCDGLWDSVNDCHLGSLVENSARDMGISREEQDRHAVVSYRRAADAWQRGAMDMEVAPVRMKNSAPQKSNERNTLVVSTDEEYSRLKIDTIGSLPPVFAEGGTITAATASSLNDGAAAIVLISGECARRLGVEVIARIISFADHGIEPANFAVAPAGAVRRAFHAGRMSSVDFHEINEAFSAVAIANMRHLDLDPSRVNVNGGAVALGHPLGASGARILCTLLSVLQQQNAETGCASISNGGGGASALVIERLR